MPHQYKSRFGATGEIGLYFFLISQLIVNGVLGALGEVVPELVEEVPRKEQDQYRFMLKMVEMDAVAVTHIHVHVIETHVEVLINIS